MESINFVKGYGKVNTSTQDQSSHHPTKSIRKPLIAVASAAIVLIVLLAVHNHNSNESRKKQEQNLPPSASVADSIRFVCNVTRYPNPCFTAISSAMGPSSASDPEAILKVSIQVSLARISDLASLFWNSSKSPPVDDCVDQLEEARSNLKQSIAAMEGEKALTGENIADLKTWISAAMTDEETCRDGMEEMGATVAEGMKAEMEDCTEMMSNSLAILVNLPALLHIFRLRFH